MNKFWLLDDFKNYKIMVHQGQADGQMQESKQARTHTHTTKLIWRGKFVPIHAMKA